MRINILAQQRHCGMRICYLLGETRRKAGASARKNHQSRLSGKICTECILWERHSPGTVKSLALVSAYSRGGETFPTQGTHYFTRNHLGCVRAYVHVPAVGLDKKQTWAK